MYGMMPPCKEEECKVGFLGWRSWNLSPCCPPGTGLRGAVVVNLNFPVDWAMGCPDGGLHAIWGPLGKAGRLPPPRVALAQTAKGLKLTKG